MKKADKLRLRFELTEERGFHCEYTGKRLAGFHLHHGIIGDKVRLKEVLFCKENLFIVDPDINTSRVLDNQKQREAFWILNCERYGSEIMDNWLERVNLLCVVKYSFPPLLG